MIVLGKCSATLVTVEILRPGLFQEGAYWVMAIFYLIVSKEGGGWIVARQPTVRK